MVFRMVFYQTNTSRFFLIFCEILTYISMEQKIYNFLVSDYKWLIKSCVLFCLSEVEDEDYYQESIGKTCLLSRTWIRFRTSNPFKPFYSVIGRRRLIALVKCYLLKFEICNLEFCLLGMLVSQIESNQTELNLVIK